MTNEQINRAVAEELGLKPHCWCQQCGEVDATRVTYGELHDDPNCLMPADWVSWNFSTDHNAAAKMRKGIRPKERRLFTQWLLRILLGPGSWGLIQDYWLVINATPLQQAEAFLRTRGKWRG